MPADIEHAGKLWRIVYFDQESEILVIISQIQSRPRGDGYEALTSLL